MTAAARLSLPTTSDPEKWSEDEKALLEAAGLVHIDYKTKTKTPAPRPVVQAFLHHCNRTGLDPIARQIYCIARWSSGDLSWQIQISIDGARLVAERSKEYEGQTTPEFTADGKTWTEVWLADSPPRAARVGVYRKGWKAPMVAVALWDAYVQTTRSGDVTEMWKKMGPLMLAKCAEMLALRKAFPQDLGGLYAEEEMSQAVVEAAAPAAAAEVEAAPVAAAEPWSAEEVALFAQQVERTVDLAVLRRLWDGALGDGMLGRQHEGVALGDIIKARKDAIEHPKPEAAPADPGVDAAVAYATSVAASLPDDDAPAVLDPTLDGVGDAPAAE